MLRVRTVGSVTLFGLLLGIALLGSGAVYAATTVFTGGINDNFVSPTEPASPSGNFVAAFSPSARFKDFDATASDRIVAHTFTGLPQGVCAATAATVEVQLRAGPDFLSHNDGINLTFVDGDQTFPPIGGERWARRIGTGHGVPGVLPYDWHSSAASPTVDTIVLDLANLPLAPGQPAAASNIISALNQHGFLDFYVQDDTDVDFVTLEIVIDCVVPIDIKPHSDPNGINSGSRGTIPVAILSTPDFDAPNEVDKDSLTFGITGDELSLAKCSKGSEDVNGDGLLDLVCHFKTQDTGFQVGNVEGVLKGLRVDGGSIQGSDSVKIVR